MKILKYALWVVVILVAGLVCIGLFSPKSYVVKRSVVINAPDSVVWAQVAVWKNFNNWSPWAKLDPAAMYIYEGTDGEVGSKMGWKGNKDVGVGEQARISQEPGKSLKNSLKFKEPFESESTISMDLAPKEGGTEVTWSMEGEMGFVPRIFGFFMGGMDGMMGKDYENGLANLKAITEKK